MQRGNPDAEGANIEISTDIVEADHYFVQDLGGPGEKISILAGMLGRVIAQETVLTCGKGHFVKYHRAITQKAQHFCHRAAVPPDAPGYDRGH